MRTYLWKKKLAFVIIMHLLLIPIQQVASGENGNPEPFFYISILVPSTYHQWITTVASVMVEQLPKIGIGIDVFDHTVWAQISPRTWGYPGPYPIPEYSKGGYDLFFISWSWGFDWDPTGLYDSPSITPNGDNFYQYNNPEMDNAINSYTYHHLI